MLRGRRAQEPVQKVNPYTFDSLTIDPKNIARRVLDIRVHLAKEWTADLKFVAVRRRRLARGPWRRMRAARCRLRGQPEKADDGCT